VLPEMGVSVAIVSILSWKLPKMLDEWWDKVSPMITFPRLIPKSWSAFSKTQVIFKKPTAAKKAKSFSKCQRWLFGAKKIAK
jgi:hypothetical protein